MTITISDCSSKWFHILKVEGFLEFSNLKIRYNYQRSGFFKKRSSLHLENEQLISYDIQGVIKKNKEFSFFELNKKLFKFAEMNIKGKMSDTLITSMTVSRPNVENISTVVFKSGENNIYTFELKKNRLVDVYSKLDMSKEELVLLRKKSAAENLPIFLFYLLNISSFSSADVIS